MRLKALRGIQIPMAFERYERFSRLTDMKGSSLRNYCITQVSPLQANQNEPLLWKIAVLGMEKPPVGA
jgi:hypothetical protein